VYITVERTQDGLRTPTKYAMDTKDTPQGRTERVSLAVTPHEKRALEFVALARGLGGAGLLLREMPLATVVSEYDKLVDQLRAA
jgi:hypothetical protein